MVTARAPLAVAAAAAWAWGACGPAAAARPARAAASAGAGVGAGAAAVPASVSVSIDAAGALVRDRRLIALAPGRTEVRIDGVPSDPAGRGLRLRSLTDPTGARAVEQQLAGGTAATVWMVDAGAGGEHEVEISYRLPGLRWRAEYAVVVERGAGGEPGRAELQAHVAIDNATGHALRGAEVVLVAGRDRFALPGRIDLPAFAVQRVNWLGGPVRGVAGATEAVYEPLGNELVSRARVPVRRRDHAAGAPERAGVNLYVELRGARLPRPLPPGRARVLERRADGRLVLLGRSRVPALPAGAPLRFRIGRLGAVTARRRQVNFLVNPRTRRVVEGIEIAIDNRSGRARRVVVRERMVRGARWQLAFASHPAAREGAQDVRFELPVPARGRATLRYRVVYSWPEPK